MKAIQHNATIVLLGATLGLCACGKSNDSGGDSSPEATPSLAPVNSDHSSNNSSLTPPKIKGDGSISVTAVLARSAVVSWEEAEGSDGLRYAVYYSQSNNLNSVSDVEINGTIAGSFAVGLTSTTINSLNEGTLYYVNVLVRNEDGLASVYQSTSFTTNYSPIPGDNRALLAIQSGDDLNISWTAAANGDGASKAISYQVYTSTSDNIGTVAGMKTYGSPLGSPTNDISSFSIEGVGFSEHIYFNVLITDYHGNQMNYETGVFDTLPELYISYINNTNRDLYYVNYKSGASYPPI